MWKIILLTALFVLTVAAALTGGAEFVSFPVLFSPEYETILRLRLERLACAGLVGGALAVAGVACQAVLRNVLAEPYVLGISGGSSLGAALAILAGFSATNALALPAGAFVGALAVLAIVVIPAGRSGGDFGNTALLAGVITGSVCGSVLMLLISVMGNTQLNSIVWWLLGNLQSRDGAMLWPASGIILAGFTLLFLFSRETNALALGGEMAHHFGVSPRRTAQLLLVTASLLTACAVSLAGIIGFVGLLVPHVMRRFVGADHRRLYPASLLGGAWFLIACDLAARMVYTAQELPVGVVTALTGGPFFLYLLLAKRRSVQ